MIPRTIHFTVPSDPRPEQREAIARAAALHPDWEVKVWRDPVDAEGFKLAKYWCLTGSGAQLADLIRIEVVYRFGGVYLDADVLLTRRLDEIADATDFFVASEDGARATNAAFGAVAGHGALESMIAELLARPPDWSVDPTLTTGPVFFARVLRWRQDITVLPRETFYPYPHNGKSKPPHPATYGVHTWSGSWLPRTPQWGRLDKLGALWNWKRLARAMVRRYRKWSQSSELAIRLLSRRVDAYSFAPTIVRRTIHGHSILLNGEDVSITPEIVGNGFYELSEELFLKRTLGGGDFFVDVGANVGIFALLAARLVGPFGRVYAYEPNPQVSELMRKSAVMNWLHDRLVVRAVAVGGAPGQAQLDFAPSRLGDAAIRTATRDSGTFARTASFLADTQCLTVDVVSLDMEFPYDIPIKVLKIDAEGYEADVLAGAWRLLTHRCIDYVMLEAVAEVCGAGWSSLLDRVEQICRLGYEACAVGTNGFLSPASLSEIARRGELKTRNLVLRTLRTATQGPRTSVAALARTPESASGAGPLTGSSSISR